MCLSRRIIRPTAALRKMSSSARPIEIDGSYKEGGGQILRNAITYAVLLRRSVTIRNIRANRPRSPGVRPQHLAGMKLAAEIGNASCSAAGGRGELIGAEVGAETVSYVYREGSGDGAAAVESGAKSAFVADTGTAGSIALLLQAAFLPGLIETMRRKAQQQQQQTVEIELRGGTNATGAPQIDYVTRVFAPFVNAYLQRSSDPGTTSLEGGHEPSISPLGIQIIKRGYFPKGGGIVRVTLCPPCPDQTATFQPIQLTKCTEIASISIKAFHAGSCPKFVAEKMVSGAVKELKRAWRENQHFRSRFLLVGGETSDAQTVSSIIDGADVEITHETNCIGSGSGILIVAHPSFLPFQSVQSVGWVYDTIYESIL